jgi:hypothetical protein
MSIINTLSTEVGSLHVTIMPSTINGDEVDYLESAAELVGRQVRFSISIHSVKLSINPEKWTHVTLSFQLGDDAPIIETQMIPLGTGSLPNCHV